MRAPLVLLLGFLQLHCSDAREGSSDDMAVGGTNRIENPATGGAVSGSSVGGSNAGGLLNNAGGGGAGVGGTASGGTSGAGAAGAAGAAGNPGAAGMPAADPEIPNGYVPALIGVGYGGIRVVSRDGGKTWGDRKSFAVDGGDDENLLRAVVYGKGMWIAMGWKLVTSSDGRDWTDHGLLREGGFLPCNIAEGLAYTAGFFYTACAENPAVTYRSEDGLKWVKYGTIGDTGGHLFMTYRAGKFVAYGDTKTSFESSDGKTFQELAGVSQATFCADAWKSAAACFDAAWFDGAYLRADWQGKISRSDNGSSWTKVYDDDQKNTLYQPRAIAPGYVAP
jgi:hypothetical protein